MAGRLRVVLVEENTACRKNTRAMLTRADLMVVGEAADGITGLKMIQNMQPDIVLADAVLPGLTGLELASIVHGDHLAPLILMSAAYDQELFEKAVAVHVYGFLIKPFDEGTLLTAVELAGLWHAEVAGLENEIRKLKDRLEARKVVEKAKGILMAKFGLSENEAFRRIQKQSMNRRIPMRAVAEAIILTEDI